MIKMNDANSRKVITMIIVEVTDTNSRNMDMSFFYICHENILTPNQS